MESEIPTPKTRRESEVWQACDDLWSLSASTKQLTGDNIRDRLVALGYKRGSPNEIYRYRTSWRESRGLADQSEGAESEVKASDPISRAVSMVYDQMRTQTSDEIAKLTEEFEAERKASLVEEQSLKEKLTQLDAENVDLRQDLVFAQKRVAELDIALVHEQKELAAYSERMKAAREQIETIRAEQERLIVELKTFHEREIDLLRTQSNEANKSLAELKKVAKAELEKQGAEFSDALMTLKTELRQAQEQREVAMAKCDALASVGALFERQQAQHGEVLAWQRKAERYLQRKPLRIAGERSKGRKC